MTEVRAEAARLADELGCEVDAHPLRPGVVVARKPTPAVWLLEGPPEEVRTEVRAAMLREFLACLGTLAQAG
jgi:hypothetical protein